LGGMRGLVHVRAFLSNMTVLVIPEQVCISKATEAFDASGAIKDEKFRHSVSRLGATVTEMIQKLRA
jgi:chromate reductase